MYIYISSAGFYAHVISGISFFYKFKLDVPEVIHLEEAHLPALLQPFGGPGPQRPAAALGLPLCRADARRFGLGGIAFKGSHGTRGCVVELCWIFWGVYMIKFYIILWQRFDLISTGYRIDLIYSGIVYELYTLDLCMNYRIQLWKLWNIQFRDIQWVILPIALGIVITQNRDNTIGWVNVGYWLKNHCFWNKLPYRTRTPPPPPVGVVRDLYRSDWHWRLVSGCDTRATA